MKQRGFWNQARENVLQDRGALPDEEGDVIGEYNAMNEENFLSSWLREEKKSRKKEKWKQKKRRAKRG